MTDLAKTLYDGILHNDLAMMREAIAGGADLNEFPEWLQDGHDGKATGPAVIAVEYNRPEALALLLEAGARTDVENKVRSDLMDIAVTKDDAGCLRVLLAHGAGPNRIRTTKDGGGTPLERSLRAGTLECVQVLVQAGADLELSDGSGLMRRRDSMTALHVAARHKDPSCLRWLLENTDADVNALDTINDFTPLHWFLHERCSKGDYKVFFSRKEMEEIVSLLLEKGAKADAAAAGMNLITPLHLAMTVDESHNINDLMDWKNMVDKLLAAGADINAKTGDGLTPLDYGVRHNRKSHTAMLLSCEGADPNPVAGLDAPFGGATPLVYAAGTGKEWAVKILLVAGALPNRAAAQGCLPLHAAVAAGNSPAVKALLEAGADPDAQSPKPSFGQLEYVHYGNPSPRTALGWALSQLAGAAHRRVHQDDNRDIIGMLVRAGAAMHADDWFRLAPTCVIKQMDRDDQREVISSAFLRRELVRILLDSEPLPTGSIDGAGNTLLHYLCGHSGLANELAALLGNHRELNVNARNARGETPLLLLLRTHRGCTPSSMVNTLLEYGADPGIPDHEGRLPVKQSQGRGGKLARIRAMLSETRQEDDTRTVPLAP